MSNFSCKSLFAVALAVASAPAVAQDKSIWEREQLTGTWGGARTKLEERGIKLGLQYIGETLAMTGGIRRGTTFEGRLDGTIEIGEPALWKGAKIFARAFQIHNARGLNAADFAGSISDPSNIDALPTTRLFTAWFEQTFGDASIRLGQLAADDEFLTSTTAGGLINGTFGWASMFAANLPSGGPAYPLATPGVRVDYKSGDLTARAAVFSGDPAGRNCNDQPQACNRYGTTFSTYGGAFWIGELQYERNQGEKATDGPGQTYKIGAWYHSGSFADQRFGIDPGTGMVVSQATGVDPLFHRGNWAVYGVIDQTLWRKNGASFSVFARGGVLPSDRNLLSWYVDGGFGLKGLLFNRPDDLLTFGVAYNKISKDAAGLDQDTLILNGPPYPIRSSEIVLELSYTYQAAKWWTIQPDIQYIIRPAGGVPHPDNPMQTVGDVFVGGVRTTITF